MTIDVAFKDLASRVASLLIDLELMHSEPYFSEVDIRHAVAVVSQQVDRMLYDEGYTRAGFIACIERSAPMIAVFLRGAFANLNEERKWL